MVYEIKGAKFNVKLLPVKIETWLDTNHWDKNNMWVIFFMLAFILLLQQCPGSVWLTRLCT